MPAFAHYNIAMKTAINRTAPTLPRRDFLKTLAATGALAAASPLAGLAASPSPKLGIKLGYDNFAIRAMNWMVEQHIEYSAQLGCDSLFMSDLDHFQNLEKSYLQDVRKKAADNGLGIHVGTWSICPTSKTFKNKWGTAEEHLRTGINVAQALGSPVIRAILGNGSDRASEGGIMARIKDTAKVCRACRSQAMDAGIKIGIENHGGDMQAREVVALIEEAGGTDYMAANLDSGNATWTLEDPLESLEIMGPFAATTSLRDSAAWPAANGVTVQWTAMGNGTVDLVKYFNRFKELCTNVPVHIETISGFNREIPYLQSDFWKAYPDMKASTLAHYLNWANKGEPRGTWSAPSGVDKNKAEQDYQKAEIEQSIRYCKSIGLGMKA